MKKLVVRLVVGVVVVALLGLAYAVYIPQRADFGWRPAVKKAQIGYR